MTDVLQHRGEVHQRLSHAYHAALAHVVAECELGWRKHDDRRTMFEPTHLVALAQSGMARNEVRAAVLEVQKRIEESQPDAGHENRRDRNESYDVAGPVQGHGQ